MTREQTYFQNIKRDLGCAAAELTDDSQLMLAERVRAYSTEWINSIRARQAERTEDDNLNSKGYQ